MSIDDFEDMKTDQAFTKKSLYGRANEMTYGCLLYTSPSPRDRTRSRMPSSA